MISFARLIVTALQTYAFQLRHELSSQVPVTFSCWPRQRARGHALVQVLIALLVIVLLALAIIVLPFTAVIAPLSPIAFCASLHATRIVVRAAPIAKLAPARILVALIPRMWLTGVIINVVRIGHLGVGMSIDQFYRLISAEGGLVLPRSGSYRGRFPPLRRLCVTTLRPAPPLPR